MKLTHIFLGIIELRRPPILNGCPTIGVHHPTVLYFRHANVGKRNEDTFYLFLVVEFSILFLYQA